jgi:small-conductance mechanosensitive channel
MSQSGFGVAESVLVGLGALVILVVGWLLARLAAVATRRALRRTELADRLARMSDEAEAGGEKVARRISRLVFALVMVLVVTLDLRLLVLPLVAEPLSALVVGMLRNGQVILGVGSVVWPIALALLATGALVLLLRTIGRLFPSVYARIASWRTTRIRPLRVQSVEFLSADRIADILLRLARGTRAALVLVIVFVYASLLFSFFPPTQALAAALFGYVSSAFSAAWQAVVSSLPNLFLILVIVIATRYIIRFVRFVFDEIGKGTITLPGFYRDWAQPTFRIVRLLILALAAVMIFPYLPGSATPAFQGISIFFGFLISLGSTSIVANVIAGVVLTYTRAFEIGDRVRIADTMGDVMEKTLLVTRVRTIKNVDVTVPNAMVLSSHIVNFSSSAKHEGLILHTTVTIGYDVGWPKVHELLISAERDTQHILEASLPFVLQTALNDFNVSYELNAYTDQPNQMTNIYSDLHRNIQDKFNEAGIEILSPHYSALRDGHQAAIPDDYLPKGYTRPAFRVLPIEWSFGKTNVKDPPTES